MDLTAFLAIPPNTCWPLLVILAQMWLPDAVTFTLDRLKGGVSNPKTSAVDAALRESFQALSEEARFPGLGLLGALTR